MALEMKTEKADTVTWEAANRYMQFLRNKGIENYKCQGCLDTGFVLDAENMAIRVCSSLEHNKEEN